MYPAYMESIKTGGRGAIIVPETFLYKTGKTKRVRELITKDASELNIISLPRGVFMPYTPEKTNILYFFFNFGERFMSILRPTRWKNGANKSK